jgi:hypothetical protein
MPKLSPLVSEFKTLEDADAYDCWFRAKIGAALADLQPALAHDKVMAEMARIIRPSARP